MGLQINFSPRKLQVQQNQKKTFNSWNAKKMTVSNSGCKKVCQNNHFTCSLYILAISSWLSTQCLGGYDTMMNSGNRVNYCLATFCSVVLVQFSISLIRPNFWGKKKIWYQGIDGSARKPALVHDTGYMVEKTYHNSTIFGCFCGLFNTSVTHKWFKRCFHIQKRSLERGGQLMLSSIWSISH